MSDTTKVVSRMKRVIALVKSKDQFINQSELAVFLFGPEPVIVSGS